MVFEVFTNDSDENAALLKIQSIKENVKGQAKQLAKNLLERACPQKLVLETMA